MNAVLFVGHGSRDPEGNEEVRAFVSSVAGTLGEPIVETCFLEFESPTIAQGIQTCVDRGATRVAVVPITLFAAGHAKLHIPGAIDAAKLKHPGVLFAYSRPIGVHELALDILSSRLEEAGIDLEENAEDTALLVIGRGSSDADANSDLYKISRLLWERLKVKWVETAFIGVTAPRADEGVERCVKLGAKRIVILPYFLFTGVLIKRLELMKGEFAEKHPDLSFVLADYFGFHPKLSKILKERADEALYGEVRMNCDMCQFRLEAAKHMDPHDHDHDHNHDHDHHDHDHEHERHEHTIRTKEVHS
ncbi:MULTISPECIES: sirohydrochlorin chelatase [unclassified Paenibacillus]|uniref:sirohydrochlorin chelatase n=1 Tax=unclassified Paenibacillus TaxID=185978 RepID=UPI001AE742D1|nr:MULTISPECIES: sirohydrochlorin chelatase [unclassified Paenibacillus]MBP1156840.1 sirohydrochlorin cobaltochelatase [Paenibacillus sp. PvP091]MBP1172421.1 sirohydrochlorin cobaltochelatase [Paenibacillus sp. PvR098]MBP2438802.1 sirohydrochlorin cobaltochelatase [Paenibacillus sp. PvP052]